jgi:hypothetical protein
MSKLHKYSAQPAAHIQDTNTGRSKGEDGDYERRGEDGDLPFPKLKSLYYYWSLIILIYFNRISVHNKQGKIGIAHELHFLVLCYMPYYRYTSLSRKHP